MIALKQSTLFTLPDGIYPDGANLYFRVRSQGKYREFLYRCTIRGKATYKSLGTAKKLTLKEARQKAKTIVPEESYPKILFKDAYLKALPHVANFKHWKNEEHATKRFEEEDVRNFGSKDIIRASNPGLYHDHENNQYQHETQIS